MLIAVAPHTRLMGVDPPRGTSDWRAERGSPENLRGVRPDYQVMHVDGALRQHWSTDAHFVLYIVRHNGTPIMKQPRVNKDGLEWLREEGYELTLEGLAADIDNPGHRVWSSQEEARVAVMAAKGKTPTAIVYATRGGLRIVQPVTRRLRPEEAEGSIATWLGQLEVAGLVPDRACLDWTRHYRLPHVVRAEVAA